jgi:hypothetical protein
MTAEGDPNDEPTTSHQLKAITSCVGLSFDFVVASSAAFTRQQLEAYADVGARPVRPDPEQSSAYGATLVTEELVAPGNLARHDPKRLGETLIEVGTRSTLAISSLEADTLAGHAPDIHDLPAIQLQASIDAVGGAHNQHF